MNKISKFIYSFLPLIMLLIVVIIVLVVFGIYRGQVRGDSTRSFVTIGDNKIYVEIADTAEKRALGLSDHENLEEDHGMLFIFDRPVRPAFWMKDMDFAIDIIWIMDNTILDISKNVEKPNTKILKHYIPKGQINYVLEVNAGYSDENKIKIGDKIEIN